MLKLSNTDYTPKMRKYLAYIKINILKHLEHRVNTIIWYFYGFIESLIAYVIWVAVYGSKEVINGFERKDLLSYFIVMSILWYFVGGTMNVRIGEEIKNGQLNLYLAKPIHPILQYAFIEQGWKIASLILILPVFLLIFFIFNLHLPITSLSQICFLCLSLILGAIIFSLWDMIIGMSAFFIQNMRPINRLSSIFYSLLSGQFIPLALMPSLVSKLNNFFFFRYTFAFPLEIIFMSDKIDIGKMFVVQIVWVVIIIFLFNIIYKLGLKRYEAVGA